MWKRCSNHIVFFFSLKNAIYCLKLNFFISAQTVICLRVLLSSHICSELRKKRIFFFFFESWFEAGEREVLAAWEARQFIQGKDANWVHRYKALFHHCHGNPSQSYFWEATSKFMSIYISVNTLFLFLHCSEGILTYRWLHFGNANHVCKIATVTKHIQENVTCRK